MPTWQCQVDYGTGIKRFPLEENWDSQSQCRLVLPSESLMRRITASCRDENLNDKVHNKLHRLLAKWQEFLI